MNTSSIPNTGLRTLLRAHGYAVPLGGMVANAEDHAHACAVAAPLAKRAGLTGAELLAGKRGKGEIPELRRQVFAALVAEGWSYPRIGRATGRDHSTIHKVLHSPKKRGAAPEASP